MSAFFRRLKYFSFGFIPGTIIVILFFQNRGCSWLPDNRVKGAILERVLVVNELNEKEFKLLGINNEGVESFVNGGSVDFDKSSTHSNPKIYLVENNGKSLYFVMPKESFVTELVPITQKLKEVKLSKEGKGVFLAFPKANEFLYVDTNRVLTCKQEELGMIQNSVILKKVIKTGYFDFKKSNLLAKRKLHYFAFPDKMKRGDIGLQALWYKDKMDVIGIDLPFDSNCGK